MGFNMPNLVALIGQTGGAFVGKSTPKWAGGVPPFKVTQDHCDVVRSGTYDFLLSMYSNS